eukprot:Skav217154  [mRNA]  locus=scaffold2621:329458:330228:- [translate_table: standard]
MGLGLQDLSEVLLLHILDLSSDASVLELAGTSSAERKRVEDCRSIGQQGSPWQHHQGRWEVSGLWRFLGLGDLKTMPHVTLCCEIKFQHVKELLAFYKAVKTFAADTVDGRVTFHNLTFDVKESANLFSGEEEHFMAPSDQTAVVDFNGRQIECSLDAHLFYGVPSINLFVCEDDDEEDEDDDEEDTPQNLLMCCSSLLLPDVRLLAGLEAGAFKLYDDHLLDAESPLTKAVRANMPLPVLFGVKGLDGGWECLDD